MKTFLVLCLLVWALNGSARADCRQDYDQAMAMIAGAKTTALKNQPLNSQQFMKEFNPVMNRMTQQGCSREIFEILQFVEREKNGYPAPK